MNYRGYGISEGKPSEKAMFQDALTIYDNMAVRSDINKEKITVMGRSMGTGVAVYLANERTINRVVLVSPYDSLLNVAQGRYPFLPVALLLNHHFDNIGRASEITNPMLTIIAGDDRIIPPDNSKTFVETWKGPATKLFYEGYGHNNIQNHPDYWREIVKFINEDGDF
ncbi:MAG: alpha/beta hydrolase [Bacillus sp. (in: Bacteria)]|nr:alpha/beta hydrolase [Bacillus sp. (in: firmicutes)]